MQAPNQAAVKVAVKAAVSTSKPRKPRKPRKLSKRKALAKWANSERGQQVAQENHDRYLITQFSNWL